MAKDPSRHYENPDPRPMTLPSGFRRPETLAEQVRRLVRSDRFAHQVAEQGFETFEEADDFDVDDDPPDPATPYEPFFDPGLGREVTPHDVILKREAYAAETETRQAARKRAKEAKQAASATPPAATPPAASQEPGKPGS